MGLLVTACASAPPAPTTPPTPPPIPGSAAVTPWEVAEDPPEGFGPATPGHRSPAALLDALLEEALRGGEMPPGAELDAGIGRVDAGFAVAWIHVIRVGDDSIAGDEIELGLVRDERGWHVRTLRYRTHCRRAVDPRAFVCV